MNASEKNLLVLGAREHNLKNKTNYKSLKVIHHKDIELEVSSSTWKN